MHTMERAHITIGDDNGRQVGGWDWGRIGVGRVMVRMVDANFVVGVGGHWGWAGGGDDSDGKLARVTKPTKPAHIAPLDFCLESF